MDDELKELEAELRRLRPAAPSAKLWSGVAQAVVNSEKRSRRRRVVAWWSPMAAAIAVAAVWLGGRGEGGAEASRRIASAENTATPETSFKPVAAEKVLLASQEEGYATLDDGTRARRIRSLYLDTIVWRNPETDASLTWTVPREEVRIVPVALQ
jgi:hypothetical protein